jgi:hypothetical protein
MSRLCFFKDTPDTLVPAPFAPQNSLPNESKTIMVRYGVCWNWKRTPICNRVSYSRY